MDPLSIILVNVGISAYNTWQNNQRNKELQLKQQEFSKAVADRNKQLTWRLLEEGQRIAEKMEEKMHEDRVRDLHTDFDNLLRKLTFQTSIATWPLRTLPIVMKNQSLGNIIANRNESVAMHCILTPSNCPSFNLQVLPEINLRLEDFFNLHWSTASVRPVLYYGNAWKTNTCPAQVEIDQLKSHLQNQPTLIITPFFKKNESGLVFRMNIWGMGYETSNDIMPTDFSYKGDTYKRDSDFVADEDLKSTTIEEFVPYLQCLISYVADQYFWNGYGVGPQLPSLLSSNIIFTDGLPYLPNYYRDAYKKITDKYLSDSANISFRPELCITLCNSNGASASQINDVIRAYSKAHEKKYNDSLHSFVLQNSFDRTEFSFLESLIPILGNVDLVRKKENEYWEQYHHKVPLIEYKDFQESISYLDALTYANEHLAYIPEADTFNIHIRREDFSIVCFFTRNEHIEHNEHVGVTVFFSPIFYVPKNLTNENQIEISISDLSYTKSEIEKIMKKDELLAKVEIVDAFAEHRSQVLAAMEKKLLEDKANEEDVMLKVKDTLDTAYENVATTVGEAKDKVMPVLEDVTGRFKSMFGKKK